MEKQFSVGVAREVISPGIGTCLFGYAPDIHSESLHDDLTATAFAFVYGETITVLISVTVCLVADELSDIIRKETGQELGIPWQNVIICATHTHSGPATVSYEGWGDINRNYCDSILRPQILKAAVRAMGGVKPAKTGTASVNSDVGINRRQISKEGIISLGQNPWGIYDTEMTAVDFIGCDDGERIGTLIHYGAHGTSFPKNIISRDWPGFMTDRVEEAFGGTCAFVNGCIGDVGPRLSNGKTGAGSSPKSMYEVGGRAAGDACRAIRSIKEYRADTCLKVASGEITLPVSDVIPYEEARKALDGFGNSKTLTNINKLTGTYYGNVVKYYEEGTQGLPARENMQFLQSLVLIGNTVLVPFPFETFSEIGLRLKNYSRYQRTLSISCANGAGNYLPSQDQICRGGYEVRMFMMNNIRPLLPDTDTRLINANLEIMEKFEARQ